jgi:formylglycine-generating enzyme required for sulfatase activity
LDQDKETTVASAITLEGIDQAVSSLKYKNKNTLKYKFVHHIRQYYTVKNAVVSLTEIEHEELIKMLWDTDHSPEAIKKKRKNLNSVRSSVNADFKKLYDKGENPEGIKIGSSNIFIMSEDAKDKILKKLGYELQPDGTLKLDQIMEILKLANETVSGSMAVEDIEKKDGLKKMDRLKDLIKGLSEKVALGSLESSKKIHETYNMEGRGGEDGAGSNGMAEALDEALVDEAEEIADLEDEVEVVDDVEDAEELDEEEIVDDIDGEAVDEIAETEIEDLVETAEIAEELEDVLDEEDAEIDDVEDVDEVEEIIGDDFTEDISDGSGPGDEQARDGIGPGQGSRQEGTGTDTKGDEGLTKDTGTGIGNVGKEDSKAVGHGPAENVEHRFKVGEEQQRGSEQLGLPVGSLGQEYKIDEDGKIKNNKLLAEEFDGYLGSMDRYYNQYILIPGGEYIIGSKHPKKDEKPEQKVYLEPFYIGRFPITNGLFEIFVEKTGYKTTAEKVGYGTVYYGRFEKKRDETTGLITSTWNSSLYCKIVKNACWYQPSGPKSTLYNKRNHPVVQISMEDARAFAAWTGKRLPTENEWEAASRTANGWILPWGQEWKNDACNIEDSYNADTTPVDNYIEFENNFSIVDTLGNVLEWTDGIFEDISKANNGEKYSVAKGGSWISENDIRLFSRYMIKSSLHSNIMGFRCVAN